MQLIRKFFKKQGGFSFIELCITIAVLAILSTAVFTALGGQTAKTRDAIRKHDLATVYNALVSYIVLNNSYPPQVSLDPRTSFASDEGAHWIPGLSSDYLKTIPHDPKQSGLPVFLAFFKSSIEKLFVSQVGIGRVSGTVSNTFLKTVAGNQSDGWVVVQTNDGGLVTFGRTYSYGAGLSDFLLTKFNKWGDVLWSKAVGGSGAELSPSMVQTPEGDFFIAGFSSSFGSAGNIVLAKFDSMGNLIWSKAAGESSSIPDYSKKTKISLTSDGGFIIAAQYQRSTLLLKFDNSANLLWSKTYNIFPFNDISVTSDNGYIAIGSNNDILLSKFDSNGESVWVKGIGGNRIDEGWSVRQTHDGGYIIAGGASSFGYGFGVADLFLAKTNSSGDLIWSRNIASGAGTGYSISETSDGGFILAGTTFNEFTQAGGIMLLVKFDQNGDASWAKTIKSDASGLRSVVQTSDGGYATVGSYITVNPNRTYHLLIKTDENGNVGGCSMLEDMSLTITSPSPSNSTVSFTSTIQNLVVNNPALTITNVSPSFTNYCLPLPETSPSPVPTPPPMETSCGNKKRVYCYVVPPDRTYFILWAQLENLSDKDTIIHSTSACSNITPPSSDFNYCLKSP